jgi:hypothetical protein
MNIHSRLLNRILVATLGVTVSTGASAFPRVNINVQSQPVAPWSDPANPLATYGLQSFSKSVYRPDVDELLDQNERHTYETLYDAGTEKLIAKGDTLAKATLLAYGLLDVALGDEAPAKTFSKMREHIFEFNSDPDRISQNIAQHLLDTEQVVLGEEDTETLISPPETRLGAKAALENLQLKLKKQDLALNALDDLFKRLSNAEIEPTTEQVGIEMVNLFDALDKCPDPSKALSALYNLGDEEIGNHSSLSK